MLITGAGRGLGVEIAKAALAAGHAVVATGRDRTKVATAVGDHANLLAVKLDVTRPEDAEAAAEVAVAKFDRIDILVNKGCDPDARRTSAEVRRVECPSPVSVRFVLRYAATHTRNLDGQVDGCLFRTSVAVVGNRECGARQDVVRRP